MIGRGGSKIKELREQTKAQLKVFKECCPNSTDRLLVINVQQEHMPDAIKEIINFLKEVSHFKLTLLILWQKHISIFH